MTNFQKYEAYKDSGVEWIGEIPVGWDVARLKDVCNINENSLPENTNKSLEIEYVDIGSVTFEEGIIQTEKLTFKAAPSRARRLAKAGDTVVSTVRTYLKAIDFIDERKSNFVFSTGFAILNPVKIHSRFLSTVVKSDAFTNQVYVFSKGMSYPAINSTELGRLNLPIPTIEEQTRIATFLDQKTAQIDQAIAQKERLIELLKERRQILIHNAVTRGLDTDVKMKDSGVEWIGEVPEGWGISKLGFYALSIQTGPFGSQLHSHDYVEDGIPVINPSHIVDGEIIPDISQTINSSKHQELKHHTLNVGDIIFGRRGEMGRCALVHVGNRPMICGTGSIKITLDRNRIYPTYLNQFLKIDMMKDWFSLNSVGSTMENLNSSILSLVPILIPPTQEQIAISTFIENAVHKIATAIACKQSEIEKLKEYKATLINSSVTGKIKI